MIVEEILNKLYMCAEKRCSICKYSPMNNHCKESLIEDLANDCRKLAEQMGDDGK